MYQYVRLSGKCLDYRPVVRYAYSMKVIARIQSTYVSLPASINRFACLPCKRGEHGSCHRTKEAFASGLRCACLAANDLDHDKEPVDIVLYTGDDKAAVIAAVASEMSDYMMDHKYTKLLAITVEF